MALGVIADPDGLSQGASTTITDAVFASAGVGQAYRVVLTSAGNNIPNLLVGEWIEIRDHSDTVNNGLYQVQAITTPTSNITLDKVSGSNPINNAVGESIFFFSHTPTTVTDMVFTATTAPEVQITSAGTNLPAMEVGERFIVFNHTTHDGTYEVVTVNTSTSDYIVQSLTGATTTAASESADTRTDVKNVMWDTAGLGAYLLEDATSEDGTLDLDGVLGQSFYSKAVIDWKDDAFLIANAPFPMLTIDSDAGKYLIGQDPSGNNSGWAFVDNSTFSVRTRKMLRNAGWSEILSDGTLNQQYAGIRTLGAFLDETAGTGDLAYYQFGTNTATLDAVDFTFNGPVNEAILVYDATVTRAQATVTEGYDFNDTGDTIDRNDGGSFITDGYKVGGAVEVSNATTSADNGTYLITDVAASVLTVTNLDGSAVTFSDTLDDNTATLAVDNRRALTLRVRERTTPGNSNARTYSQADLADAGETILSNRLFTFGLSNAQDLNITATDATIDGANDPYQLMSINYSATPVSRGNSLGGGDGVLVGGPYNFGIIIDGGNGVTQGTNTEVYEWTQRQLRRTAVDANVDSSTKIGAQLDGLMRFVGPTLEVGSTDGGLSFPVNPDGGGSGVYINYLNAASSNDTVYYDNTGTLRQAPLTVAVTLDFNQTLIDDTVAEYTLFFDYTRRTDDTALTDLVITAGTGADGTFTSAGSNLPATDANLVVNDYVRVSGLTGADEPMNGIYQLTAETTPNDAWAVTRYDGATIVTTSSAAVNLDEHPIDGPDAIIVEDNTNTDVTGLASADFTFSFDYSNNTQGGRTASTDADVICRAIGQATAQYTQSSIQTISTTALTIPVTSQIERNFNNP
jgi:hypothetical protein